MPPRSDMYDERSVPVDGRGSANR